MTDERSESPRALVLVVEDQPRVAQMLMDVLEAYGYQAEAAANGLIALGKIEARAYDIIISDLRMPELDGMGLYREIKRRQPELLSRFLFVSGTTDEPEYQRFLAENPVPILAKPFVLADLYELTRQVLATHKCDREGA
jgi:CheY-like chemotaxis protein